MSVKIVVHNILQNSTLGATVPFLFDKDATNNARFYY